MPFYPMINEEIQTSHYGVDYFGQEVLIGDEIMVLDDEFFLKDELLSETVKVLELAGATTTIAQ
ncbi:hypothetical protein OEV98_11170 [Caldibacillus lycopersici]|uniref:Uncharacterized protein n=1 Tax=Perspicuibacillus lycopersici TaxID=1325689 RepID=A0AAE3IVG6_9BACI|nr:hypothetical protein [Perspicuibacillus lycopersici]MCU9614121.1 hypothetical protein [Perspicuibacillus lycopersici]